MGVKPGVFITRSYSGTLGPKRRDLGFEDHHQIPGPVIGVVVNNNSRWISLVIGLLIFLATLSNKVIKLTLSVGPFQL